MIHVDDAFAPTLGEYFPASQGVHAAVPFATLYLPAMHAWQEPEKLVGPGAHDCTFEKFMLGVHDSKAPTAMLTLVELLAFRVELIWVGYKAA